MALNRARQPENYGKVYFKRGQAPNLETVKFKMGDTVRISKYKRKTFDKGYTPNWTEEVFVISEIKETNPVTYKIKDRNGEEIKGAFLHRRVAKDRPNYL